MPVIIAGMGGSVEPSKITALTPSRRDPDRIKVRAGRRVLATLPRKRVEAMGLTIGQAVDEALAERLAAEGTREKALTVAWRMINRRALSRWEIIDRLQRRGYEAATAQAAADRLVELGAVDDRELGRALLREMQRSKPAGVPLMVQRLRQRGLSEALARELTEEASRATDPVETAAAFIQCKAAAMQRLDPITRKRRLWGQLARRGLDSQTIEQALDRVLGDTAENEVWEED